MNKLPLHITNGDVLTNFLNELGFDGEILTWQEMLCEGPTIEKVGSNAFLKTRQDFFSLFYNIDLDTEKIKKELEKLNHLDNYSEIVLWFEYDLFCHINMVAVISLLQQKKIDAPIFLVCSGRIEGSKNLKGLAELNSEQLMKHFENKVLLNEDDITMATTVWSIYCGIDHNLLKPFIVKPSSFKYLSNCLKAHLERFPDSVDGLNVLEKNILEIINKKEITSKNQLLGYALNYQGFYGYGDLQIERIINKLSIFFTFEDGKIKLNRDGHEALLGQYNFSSKLNNNMIFGGVKKSDFQFSKSENRLIKSV
ncbi:DUF1835 domain-containing protein [Sabulilitoribacter multivorans]|uniref:DUF1835 domain-containing protein n=1 Tax=Flaviramulus multivorans TaxID=1304750 RepID=A0ABS9IJA8_9FLAO|nr:DUF1835 domain-containing protein [Flaviramulus multivorans]MCF7560680.1 DUF1835 domain-containing protein [Flaviramulus multivorans]